MCAPLLPSWLFTLTVSKEMNNLARLSRIFIRNWAAACSSGWIQVTADSIPWLTWVPAAGYELQLILSCSWLKSCWLDTSCYWLSATTDLSSGGWIQVTADSFLLLTRVPAAGYDLRLIPSCGWLWVAADSSFGSWVRVTADYILQLTRVPVAGYDLRLIPSCDWL